MSADTGTCRRILLYGNPILRMVARDVDRITPEITELIADLKATMVRRDGVGLAANQIGAPVAIFALNPPAADIDLPPICLINPQIVAAEGKIEAEEGCLSFPDIFEVVSRPEMVIVKWVDDAGKERQLEASGLLARAIVHEYEHLQGVLFIDHLSAVRRKMLASRLKELEEEEQKACA